MPSHPLSQEELDVAPKIIEEMRRRGKKFADLTPQGQDISRRFQTYLEAQGFRSYSEYAARGAAPARPTVTAPAPRVTLPTPIPIETGPQQPPGFLRRAAETVIGPGGLRADVLGDVAAAIPPVVGVGLVARAIAQGVRGGRAARAAELAARASPQVPLIELPTAVAPLGRRIARGAGEALTEVAGTARALTTSFDLSGARQVLPTAVAFPKAFARGFIQQFRSLARPAADRAMAQEIAARPSFGLMREAGVRLPSLEGVIGASQREEMFLRAHIAENLGLGIGRGVKASERGYNAIVTRVRADVFDRMLADTQKITGREVNEAELKSIGTAVNTLTGRGDLGRFQELGATLSTTLFAPRYMFSKLNFINPWFYARLEPAVRKQFARAAVGYAGLIGTTMALARASGLPVQLNPLSADWGKLVVPAKELGTSAKAAALALAGLGLTGVQSFNNQLRIDLTQGWGTYIRAAAQTLAGRRITTGGRDVPAPPEEVAGRFLAGKAAPVPGLVLKILRQQEVGGGRVNVPGAVIDTFAPIFVQDVRDVVSPPAVLSTTERRKRGLEFFPVRLR